MLETIAWGGVGIFCGMMLGGFALGFIDARKNHMNKAGIKSELFSVTAKEAPNTTPEIMVKLIPAVNGRLLEVSTKKAHPMHPGHWEWENEMFIVEEGQTLSQAIAMVMLMKGLEK